MWDPWKLHYISSAIIENTRTDIYGNTSQWGPIYRIEGKHYLYLRPDSFGARYLFWSLNPCTALTWPLATIWNAIESVTIGRFLGWLWDQGVFTMLGNERFRYRDIPRYLWFSKSSQKLRADWAQRDKATDYYRGYNQGYTDAKKGDHNGFKKSQIYAGLRNEMPEEQE